MKLSHIMLAATMLLATTTAHAQSITGAGATFPAPLYAKLNDSLLPSTHMTAMSITHPHPQLLLP